MVFHKHADEKPTGRHAQALHIMFKSLPCTCNNLGLSPCQCMHTTHVGVAHTHEYDNGVHSASSQGVEVVVQPCKMDVVHSEILPLVHVVNVRVLHVLKTGVTYGFSLTAKPVCELCNKHEIEQV